jgi:hypothetical protein
MMLFPQVTVEQTGRNAILVNKNVLGKGSLHILQPDDCIEVFMSSYNAPLLSYTIASRHNRKLLPSTPRKPPLVSFAKGPKQDARLPPRWKIFAGAPHALRLDREFLSTR